MQIFETEFWIVLARQNRWFKRNDGLDLEDLKKAGVPRIESRHRDYSGDFPAHFHSKRLGLTDAPWLQTNQHEIKKKLVLGGYGFALLTRHTVEAEVRAGKLLRVRCPQKLLAPIYAVWRKGRSLDRISKAFLERFKGELCKGHERVSCFGN